MKYVYVLNVNKQPLRPTSKFSTVRKLLKEGKAKVVNQMPFTIQLLYETTNIVQDISLGVDSGSKVVDLSASTKKMKFN